MILHVNSFCFWLYSHTIVDLACADAPFRSTSAAHSPNCMWRLCLDYKFVLILSGFECIAHKFSILKALTAFTVQDIVYTRRRRCGMWCKHTHTRLVHQMEHQVTVFLTARHAHAYLCGARDKRMIERSVLFDIAIFVAVLIKI